MAENALFLSSRAIDAATLVASSEEGALVVGNLQDRRPEKKLRFTGCASEYVTFDFGQDVVCNSIIIVGHNLTALGTFRLRLASSAANVTAAPGKDSTPVSAWPTSGKHSDPDWPQELSLVRVVNTTGYRYGRLDIADPTNPAGYAQIGRLYAGLAFQPTFNVDTNVGLGLVSPDKRVRSPHGRTYSDPRGPSARRMLLPISAVTESEMKSGLFELQRYCGLARDLAFCLDPAATTRFHTFSMQASFENDADFASEPWFDDGANVWRAQMTLTEYL